MSRLLLLCTLFAVTALSGCGSSAPASAGASRSDAEMAVAEAQRALERAEADPSQAPYLEDARQAAQTAAGMLASGQTDEAIHRAYLARQSARIAELQAEIDRAEQAQAEAPEGGNRVVVTDAFQSARVTLKPDSRATVDRVATYLVAHPGLFVMVESFTDATGNADRNLDLSVRRGEAVKARLGEGGVAAGRVVVVGYGQEFPVAPNTNAAGQRENRRVEFSVSDRAEAFVRRTP